MPENLQLFKTAKEKRASHKNSLNQYIWIAKKILYLFPDEKVENICPMSLAMFNMKLNNYFFNKRLAKIHNPGCS